MSSKWKLASYIIIIFFIIICDVYRLLNGWRNDVFSSYYVGKKISALLVQSFSFALGWKLPLCKDICIGHKTHYKYSSPC